MYDHNPARPATPAQLKLLGELGVDTPGRLSSYEADRLIKANFDRWARMPPTAKQERFRRLRGRWLKPHGRLASV